MGRGNGLPRTLESVASQLNTHFPTVAYIIPTTEDFGGSPLQQRDGYCIESCLGHSAKHEGYSTYALAQSVCAAYPTLVITFVVDLRDPDREPAHGPARITAAIDHNLSAFSTQRGDGEESSFNPTTHKWRWAIFFPAVSIQCSLFDALSAMVSWRS